MDALTDPNVSRVTWMKSKRVGYTKIVTALNGYHMTNDPCNILHVQPTVEDAEGYSKDELDPMIRDVPAVTAIFGDVTTKDKTNTILKKNYPGGVMYLTGANSGRGFRRISVRIVELDEADAYPYMVGKDGNVVGLAEGRAEDAWNSKVLLGSTPLIKGNSVIAASYEESDKRRYHVPCPHCDHGQVFKWGGKEQDFGFKWEKGSPSTVAYLCEQCHCLIDHADKFDMIERGQWISEAPFVGHAGFHLWAAYSYLPKASWEMLVAQWERAQRNPTLLQVFVNTVLGEPWEETGEAVSEEGLMARRESYPVRVVSTNVPGENDITETLVPRGVALLTSFTDVQNNRLETQIMGWGDGEEVWAIDYQVLFGDPTSEAVWQQLWELLMRPLPLERGGVDYVRSSCIDSGYAAQSVYSFVAHIPVYQTPDSRLAYMWATKGYAGVGQVWPRKPGKSSMTNVPLWPIKVDTAKDTMSSRLRSITEPGPGYVHFPMSFEEDYFRQLTSEQAFNRPDKKGFVKRVWEMKKGRQRNEVWDTVVGNYVALCALYSIGLDLDAECQDVKTRLAWASEPKKKKIAAEKNDDDDSTNNVGTRSPNYQSSDGWLGRGKGWLR